MISGALLFMGNDLHLTPFTTGLVTSSLLFGAAFGALASGHFAAAAGRRKIILVLAVIFAIGAIGTALAPDVEWMIFFRLVLGVAVGSVSDGSGVHRGDGARQQTWPVSDHARTDDRLRADVGLHLQRRI